MLCKRLLAVFLSVCLILPLIPRASGAELQSEDAIQRVMLGESVKFDPSVEKSIKFIATEDNNYILYYDYGSGISFSSDRQMDKFSTEDGRYSYYAFHLNANDTITLRSDAGRFTCMTDAYIIKKPATEGLTVSASGNTAFIDEKSSIGVTAYLKPNFAAESIHWKSSNSQIARVETESGRYTNILPVNPGECEITASAGKFTASCHVTVKKSEEIKLNQEYQISITPCETLKYKVLATEPGWYMISGSNKHVHIYPQLTSHPNGEKYADYDGRKLVYVPQNGEIYIKLQNSIDAEITTSVKVIKALQPEEIVFDQDQRCEYAGTQCNVHYKFLPEGSFDEVTIDIDNNEYVKITYPGCFQSTDILFDILKKGTAKATFRTGNISKSIEFQIKNFENLIALGEKKDISIKAHSSTSLQFTTVTEKAQNYVLLSDQPIERLKMSHSIDCCAVCPGEKSRKHAFWGEPSTAIGIVICNNTDTDLVTSIQIGEAVKPTAVTLPKTYSVKLGEYVWLEPEFEPEFGYPLNKEGVEFKYDPDSITAGDCGINFLGFSFSAPRKVRISIDLDNGTGTFCDIISCNCETLREMPAKEATCETNGNIHCWHCEFCGKYYSDAEGKNLITSSPFSSATGHDWNQASYKWADDGRSCTATRICKNDETHVETATAKITSEQSKAPTCTEKGETTYTAKFEGTDWATQQQKTIADVNPIGHCWGEPTYEWSNDGRSCTATRICKNNAKHTEIAKGTVTEKEKDEPTYDAAGYVIYTATFGNTQWAESCDMRVELPKKDRPVPPTPPAPAPDPEPNPTDPEETVPEVKPDDIKPDDKGNVVIGSGDQETAQMGEAAIDAILKNTEEHKNAGMKVETKEATVEYDSKAMETIIKEIKDAKSVSVTVKDAADEKKNMTQQQQTVMEKVEKQENTKVFSITLEITRKDNSKSEIHDFGGGKSTITVSYKAPSGKKVIVYRLENDGTKTLVESFYDAATGKLSFVTPSHSYYVVTTEDADQKEGWNQDAKGWFFMENGQKLQNKWRKDNTGWCYVGKDGYMVTETWAKDSHGWCWLDRYGHQAFKTWARDSKDWCYVDVSGYMVTKTWERDSHGWCYLGADGRMARDTWAQDSIDWCYVDENGYLVTDIWVQDSHGWYYLKSDGRLLRNSYANDSTGRHHLNADGRMDW